MATQVVGLTLFLNNPQSIGSGTKHVAFAYDIAGVEKLRHIKSW